MNDTVDISRSKPHRVHIRCLDQICDTFESAWIGGERPAVEKYLGDTPEPERTELLGELIRVDVHYRRKAGDVPLPADYSRRFPTLPELFLTNAVGLSAPGLGAVLNGYRLKEELGRGGMGRVYRAAHPRLDQDVALKVLQPGLDSGPVVARFEAERQTLARMDHPHIARVIDGGVTDDARPFFVMELVRGVPITRYCDKQRLNVRQRLELFITVCQAVQHAHQKGIIHRDLKPSNILVAEYDGKATPKVIDFGIARATERRAGLQTEAGMLVGTPEYMSPEQADLTSQDIDTRSDIYSLGIVLYELLTGETPFAHRAANVPILEVLRMIREVDPAAPSARSGTTGKNQIRGELDWITLKCLDKDRTRRYDTAAAVAEDVRRFLDDEPVTAGPPSTTYRLSKFIKRNRGAVIAAGLVLAALVAGTVGTTWGMFRARTAKNEALTERDVANAVKEFFQKDLLATASVKKQQYGGHTPKPNLTVREALDRAAQRIPGKFDRHPLVEAGIRHTIGDAYNEIGEFAAADPHLVKAVGLYRSNLPPRDVRVLESLHSLGNSRHYQGRNQEAVELFEQVLDAYRPARGPADQATLQVLNDLAAAHMDLSQLARAEEVLKEALEFVHQYLSPDDATTLATRKNMASLHMWRSEFSQAEAIYRDVYQILQRTLGPMHLDTLRSEAELALALIDLARFPEAEALLTHALDGLLRDAGPEHPLTIQTRLDQARLFVRQGNRSSAEPVLIEVVDTLRKVMGPEHRLTLSAQLDLAVLYHQLNRLTESETLHRDSYAAQLRALGPNHRETLHTLKSYAGICMAVGKLDQAEALCQSALEGMRVLHGPESPATLDCHINLGNLYAVQGKFEKAADTMASALALSRKQGPTSNASFRALKGLGVFQEKLGNLTAAEIAFRESVEAARTVRFPAPSPFVESLYCLGQNLIKQQRLAEAEPLLQEALRALSPTQKTSWMKPQIESLLGQVLLSQERFAEAEPLLVAGYEGLYEHRARLTPGAKPYVGEALARVVHLYDRWGKSELASEWRRKQSEAASSSSP